MKSISNAVFIGGCPRSGTTYLASLLANFERVIVTPESKFKHTCYHKARYGAYVDSRDLEFCIERDFYFALWGCALEQKESDVLGLNEYKNFLDKMVIAYAKKNNVLDNSLVWVDHTPSNFSAGNLMRDLYPDSKFIHIVRDPRAVISSLLKRDWGPHDLVACCEYWKNKVSLANAFCAANPESCMVLKYEDLISDATSKISQVAGFLGLNYVSRKGELTGKYVVPEYSFSQHQLVGNRPDCSRIDGWKNDLDALSVKYIEESLGDYFDIYGYEKFTENISRIRLYKARVFFTVIQQRLLSLQKMRRRKLTKRKTVESVARC